MASSSTRGAEYKKWPPACIPCAKRKIKCDRTEPCTSCRKSGIRCSSSTAASGTRKKRKTTTVQDGLTEGVDSGETVPQEAQNTSLVNVALTDIVDSVSRPPLPTSAPGLSARPVSPGVLVEENDGHRYYEHSLMAHLGQKYDSSQHERSSTHQSNRNMVPSGINFISHERCTLYQAASLQSPPASALKDLLNIFFTNVHPLVMILHEPTGRAALETAVDPETPAADCVRALVYSVGACALMSLQSNEQRSDADVSIDTLRSLAWHYLHKASFLKSSNAIVLQCLLLLLTSMQLDHEPLEVWTLTGIAVRIAQRLGAHRDGTLLKLKPFQTEMRRRMWWYLVALDSRTTEMAGCGRTIPPESWDTKMPLNVNDCDLDLNAEKLPPERGEWTDMSFCLIRYHTVSHFMQHFDSAKGSIGPRSQQLNSIRRAGERRHDNQPLQNLIETTFLRFADPTVPIQGFAATIARSMLCKLTMMANFGDGDGGLEERFSGGSKILRHDNFLYSTKAFAPYNWFAKHNFPWGGLMLLLHGLERRAKVSIDQCSNKIEQRQEDQMLRERWSMLEEAFGNHPELFSSLQLLRNLSIADLTLEAWNAEASRRGTFAVDTTPTHAPQCIEKLRQFKSEQGKPNQVDYKSQEIAQTAFPTDDLDLGLGMFDLEWSAWFPQESATFGDAWIS